MGIATEPHQFHVLAVDDSLIDRKLIERLLKTSSYQVTTVDSGSKALQFLGLYEDETGSPPDSLPATLNNHQEVNVNLIITDYCMPGMTGYDLLKKIKESSFLKSIPVVIMSSENIPSRISRCLEGGAEEFFLKPVQLADVNRLKPHMMKFKFKDQQQVKPHESSLNPELQPLPPLSQHHQQQQEAVAQQQPQPVPQQTSSNKRKAMEDGLSPDRTRPRYSGLAMV